MELLLHHAYQVLLRALYAGSELLFLFLEVLLYLGELRARLALVVLSLSLQGPQPLVGADVRIDEHFHCLHQTHGNVVPSVRGQLVQRVHRLVVDPNTTWSGASTDDELHGRRR